MSAAPLVSSAHLEDDCAFSNPSKRLRRSDFSDLESSGDISFGYEASVAATSATFASNMELLRERFPTINDGVLSSILESTGDKLNLATALLTQLVNVRAQRSEKPNRAKRRRPASPSAYAMDCGEVRRVSSSEVEEGSAQSGAKSDNSGVMNSREYLQQSASQVLMRLRGVRSESEAFNRLQPVLLEIVQSYPELQQARSLQRVLTKAIFRQEDRIQGLSDTAARSDREVQEWRKKALELEAMNQELQRVNRGLKDANNILSYYIKSTTEQTLHLPGHGYDGPPNAFEGGFHGPDVC